MSIGMMIYLLICGLIGLALVVLAIVQIVKGNGNVQAGGDVWKDKQ
mgnify:CR=1 FL=1